MSSILTPEKLEHILSEYSVPSAFSHFTGGHEPPFITWLCPNTDNFNADNSVYAVIPTLEIELYSRVNVVKEEAKLEAFLTEKGIVWDKSSQTWLDDEKVMMTIYEVS